MGVRWILPLAVPLVLSCGGRLGDFPGPGVDAGADGEAGDLDSGQESSESPDSNPGGSVTACPIPATLQSGAPCSLMPGTVCPSAAPIYGCTGQVLGYGTCTCSQNSWTCSQPVTPRCPPPPPPLSTTCPAPKAVLDAMSCAGIASNLTCPGNPQPCGGGTFFDALQCNGSTWVTLANTVCGVDGGTD